MLLKDIENFFKNYKRGAYTRIEKATNKNGYEKRVAMVCRFVNYYNIKQVKEANKTPTHKEYERIILPHILKENTNTKNILLMVYMTQNTRQKAKTSYFYNGAVISEDAYYQGIGEKKRPSSATPVICFNINDVVSLGGAN
jgi:hypothetical protein